MEAKKYKAERCSMMRRVFMKSLSVTCYFTIIAALLTTAVPSLAFTASSNAHMKLRSILTTTHSLLAHHHRDETPMNDVPRRRPQQSNSLIPPYQFITTASAMAVLTLMLSFPVLPSNAGLLDEYGAGLTINPSTTTKSEVVVPTPNKPPNGGNVQIDPTLRGSYYYPTAKKRYLPRILKASDALKTLPEELATAAKAITTSSDEEYSWDRVLELVATVDDAVLPLQLYQSSLTGQGLSLNNEYATRMKDAALRYERSAKQLATLFQINKKSTNPSKTLASTVGTQETKIQTLLVDLTAAMTEYRTQGRLTDADNMSIPSATPEEMRRMAMRSKPATAVVAP